jgi:hypothetical protein
MHLKSDEEKHLALLKAPSKQPKTTTLQVHVKEEVSHNLDRYVKFIDATAHLSLSERRQIWQICPRLTSQLGESSIAVSDVASERLSYLAHKPGCGLNVRGVT